MLVFLVAMVCITYIPHLLESWGPEPQLPGVAEEHKPAAERSAPRRAQGGRAALALAAEPPWGGPCVFPHPRLTHEQGNHRWQ